MNTSELQIWILGGINAGLLLLLIFFAKSAFNEMKEMIAANTRDIIRIDKQVQVQGQVLRSNNAYSEIMTTLRAMGSGEPLDPDEE